MAEEDKFAKFIDNLFSMDRTKLILLGLFTLALILRVIAAINISVSADDMHHVIHAINFYDSGRLVTYDQSAGLWHSLTSIIYSIFGVGQFTSRFLIVIFGSFTVFAVYLLSCEFFSRKISLIAAFLTAVAPFHIKLTVGEMDVMAMFFVIMSVFLFVKGLKSDKKLFFIISGVSTGLALYTKVYPILFIPSLLIYFVHHKKKSREKVLSKRNIKIISLFLLSAFLFAIPVLAHNYLLYQDKGFLDLQFTRTLGLGKDKSEQFYGWDHQFSAKNDWKGLIFGNSSNYGNLPQPTLAVAINFLRIGDPSVFYLGIAGLFIMLIYKKNRDYALLFGLLVLFALPFLASIILLGKHYLFMELLMIPIAAFTINVLLSFIKNKYNLNALKPIIAVLIIVSFIVLGLAKTSTTPHFFGKSAVGEFMSLKEQQISDNSLIVADSRIYTGQVNWMAYGRPYLEATSFIQLLNAESNPSGNMVNTDIYFIECVSDDCGWGTIKDQPELNATMEQFIALFKERAVLVKDITEPSRDISYYPFQSQKIESRFKVYMVQVPVSSKIIQFASQPKDWFLYSIGYANPENQFDSFSKNTFLKNSIYDIARSIILISIILSVLSLFYVLFLTFSTVKE